MFKPNTRLNVTIVEKGANGGELINLIVIRLEPAQQDPSPTIVGIVQKQEMFKELVRQKDCDGFTYWRVFICSSEALPEQTSCWRKSYEASQTVIDT